MKKFSMIQLFGLTLKREPVPSYGDTHEKEYPQRIPAVLVALCFFNSALKLAVPLVLEEVYSHLNKTEVKEEDYLWLMGVVIAAIGLSQAVFIAYGLVLSLYRFNVRREVSSRVITNNFSDYQALLESSKLGQGQGSMQLWVKSNTRLSVYLHNYYQSYLNLIFQCLNIVAIILYLFLKLSFSLFFGLGIAGLVMYKTITTAGVMTNVRFSNIALRARRLKLLQGFFTRVSEFKMSWLDKWVYNRVTQIERQFQEGLREIKLLDCWCVALWQFTGVGISSIVITAYFLLGLNETVDPQSVFTPSTFIYLLGMLNFPLNALSWYIAGIRTAERAIKEMENDVRLPSKQPCPYKKIQQQQGSLLVTEPIELVIDNSSEKTSKSASKLVVPIREFRNGRIYSVAGELGEDFLSKLVFLLSESIVKGYVQENAWLCPSSLETICMQPNLHSLSNEQQKTICQLLELFDCGDIPLHTNTQNYSGGQKLRVSLVRAFHLGKVIVINSNLNSLDQRMKKKAQQSIRRLVATHHLTVFIRENQEISDEVISFERQKDNGFRLSFKEKSIKQEIQVEGVIISPQILQFMEKSLIQTREAIKEQQVREASMRVDEINHNQKQQQKSVVSWQTFTIYYKSPKHIWFALSMLFVTLLSNYYNYYVNTYINLAHYDDQQVIVIVVLTLIFAVGLFFRSYLFADANLDEASRICHDLNRNILMEQLPFYQSEEQIRENEQAASKSQLVCVLSSDTETIADQFPFSTNIFANNITVVISCIVVILLEVPQMLILVCLLVAYSHSLNKVSHRKDEALKAALKLKEVQVYNSVSLLQASRKYLLLHSRLPNFLAAYQHLREQHMELDWLSQRYRAYINLKYKAVMMLFLLVAVVFYSLINVFGAENTGNKSSGLALLIQYTIQLSNYLLYFTMSIWQIKGQAVSLERIKPYLAPKANVEARVKAADQVIEKLRKTAQSEPLRSSSPLISIHDLTFAYHSNPNCKIFRSLDLQVKAGDQVIIKGRSGAGKTTLYKLLTSAYPSVLDLIQEPFHISFSPQHPLLLPDSTSLEENLNPYQLKLHLPQLQAARKRHGLEKGKNLQELTYEQKIVVNNLRAYLHGYRGVTIYDEPQQVVISGNETYLIVTHHHQFPHNKQLQLTDGRLIEDKQ